MKAYELIDSPDKWWQGGYAYSPNGAIDQNGEVYPTDPSATRWCIVGAIIKIYGDGLVQKEVFHKLCARVQEIAPPQWGKLAIMPAQWNDAPERTHAEVYNLLKELDI